LKCTIFWDMKNGVNIFRWKTLWRQIVSWLGRFKNFWFHKKPLNYNVLRSS
jgi:hypothetical protein